MNSPASLPEPLSACLRRLREQSGLSRSELAERTGFSRPTIWAWETGKSQPRDRNLQMLAQALGIPESELGGQLPRVRLAELAFPAASEWRVGPATTDPSHARRLRILIYASRLCIAAFAGVRARNVHISIDY